MSDRFILYGKYEHTGTTLDLRVGIGTADPKSLLDVAGSINATELTIIPSNLPLLPEPKALWGTDLGGNVYEWTYDPSDLAEIFPAHEAVGPGDIVVIDPDHPEKIQKSISPYDHNVIGVVSFTPAVTLKGHQMIISPSPVNGSTDSPAVALAGRVPIKVSLENGPISKGDLLTSSSTPGVAMRADRIPQAQHAIIGKALQDYNSHKEQGTGLIQGLVFTR